MFRAKMCTFFAILLHSVQLSIVTIISCQQVHLALGLECYTSDTEHIQSGYTLQDCQKYQGPANLTTTNLCCYTFENGREVIKGCAKKGECNIMINHNEEHGKMKCTECTTDGCNREVFGEVLEPTPPANLVAKRGETSLKCLYCLEPCDVRKAAEKICGQNIGKSHEAVCTQEVKLNGTVGDLAIRKCQVVKKGQLPVCPSTSDCRICRSDLCNDIPIFAGGMSFNKSNLFIYCFIMHFLIFQN